MKSKKISFIIELLIYLYGMQVVVVILEYFHYGLWRHNILWFEYRSVEDIVVAILGLAYFAGFYFVVRKMSKKVKH